MKIKANDFDLVVKKWQLIKKEILIENIFLKVKILYDQADWLN